MAKGFEKHKARQDALTRLGRTLARRASSSCELCGESGVPLAAFEVPPIPEEPDADRCAFSCEPCTRDMVSEKSPDPRRWRLLEHTMWSDVPAVQVMAVRLLRRLARTHEAWAHDALEELYLDPAVEEWVDQGA